MKKILIILFLFLSVHAFAEYKNSVIVKAGITPYSIVETKIGTGLSWDTWRYNNQTANVGTVLHVEYFRDITRLVSIGGGGHSNLVGKHQKVRIYM